MVLGDFIKQFRQPLGLRIGTRTIPGVLVLVLSAGLISCAKSKLKKIEEFAIVNAKTLTVKADYCTTNPLTTEAVNKLLFIIDKSGSNNTTDPGGTRRFPPIINYVGSQGNTDDTFYGLITFQGNNYRTASDFTNNTTEFVAAVVGEQGFPDGGGTPYLAALSAARAMILADVQRAIEEADAGGNPPASAYSIFFISDGGPTDNVGDGSDAAREAAIMGSIQSLLDVEQDNPDYVNAMVLHTGYYYVGSPSPLPQQLLIDMAAEGRGEAETFLPGVNIDFSRFKLPGTYTGYTIDQVFLTNVNAGWDAEGKFLKDSDGDGMFDKEELEYGSDPFNVDSDGNYVSDGIEFKKSGRPCFDQNCDPSRARSYSCSVEDDGSILDTDRDLLNDCEERVLGTDFESFDSNSDFIPDRLGFIKGVKIKEEEDTSQADPDLDGNVNFNEIRLGTPIWVDNNAVVGLKAYKYKLVAKPSDNEYVACYSITIENVSVIGNGNLLRMYMIESPQLLGDRKRLRIAEKRAESEVGTVEFSRDDFR